MLKFILVGGTLAVYAVKKYCDQINNFGCDKIN